MHWPQCNIDSCRQPQCNMSIHRVKKKCRSRRESTNWYSEQNDGKNDRVAIQSERMGGVVTVRHYSWANWYFDHTHHLRFRPELDRHSRADRLEEWLSLCRAISCKIGLSLSLFENSSFLSVSMVAMPTGYKTVISPALGMHGIYCTQPLDCFVPSCFGAINAIHPSCPWCNYYLELIDYTYIFKKFNLAVIDSRLSPKYHSIWAKHSATILDYSNIPLLIVWGCAFADVRLIQSLLNNCQ